MRNPREWSTSLFVEALSSSKYREDYASFARDVAKLSGTRTTTQSVYEWTRGANPRFNTGLAIAYLLGGLNRVSKEVAA